MGLGVDGKACQNEGDEERGVDEGGKCWRG